MSQVARIPYDSQISAVSPLFAAISWRKNDFPTATVVPVSRHEHPRALPALRRRASCWWRPADEWTRLKGDRPGCFAPKPGAQRGDSVFGGGETRLESLNFPHDFW